MTAPQFDYVIVGGGSAGATLANRLSADPQCNVCLLEAGGDGRDVLIRAPMAAALMLPGKPLKINNWAFETTPQVGLNGRRGYHNLVAKLWVGPVPSTPCSMCAVSVKTLTAGVT